jgi:hypothetical protein
MSRHSPPFPRSDAKADRGSSPATLSSENSNAASGWGPALTRNLSWEGDVSENARTSWSTFRIPAGRA